MQNNDFGRHNYFHLLTLRGAPHMKTLTVSGLVFTILVSPASHVLAQSPYDQPPDLQALLDQNPHMQDMQAFQTRYDNIKKARSLERKAITDQIYAEELDRAKKEQATQGPFYDPVAASEWAAKQRIEQLGVQWKKEDQELDAQMHKEMMNNTSMGGMYEMQQNMMKQYGYSTPAPE
jgi:hypothetical protein